MRHHPSLFGWGERAARLGALFAGYAALALSVAIAVEVVGRKLFAFSLQGVDEIGGYVMAVGVTLSFAFALGERAHTRVDLVIARLPVGLRAPLNALAAVALFVFAAFMAWRGASVLDDSIAYQSRASTPLQTPLWLPQGLWLAGLLLFATLAGLFAGRAVWLLVRGRIRELDREFGPLGIDEEIAEAREAEAGFAAQGAGPRR